MTKAPGVDTSRLRKEIRQAMWAADFVCWRYGEELVITSCFEGLHKEGSLHFKNRAFDMRSPRTYLNSIVDDLREFIGPDFDVVVESDHVHVEHDPK